MARVARQMVEQAGVNVDVLLDKLLRAAGAEFTTFYYYTILRVNSIGFDGEGLKEIIEDARIEDRNHFEALFPRIYELGGALPPVRGYRGVPRRLPAGQSHGHEGHAGGSGRSRALRRAHLYGNLQHDFRQGPPHLRDRA